MEALATARLKPAHRLLLFGPLIDHRRLGGRFRFVAAFFRHRTPPLGSGE